MTTESALSDLAKEHYFVDEYVISGFFGEHRFLSNAHECTIKIDDIVFFSSEHAFMAEKTVYREEKEKIAAMPTFSVVKKYGSHTMTISKENWEYYRVAAMMKVLFAKFFQNPDLAERLLATGDKLLIETNWWKDRFWGEDKSGNGQNMLGECLMTVRFILREMKP